MRRSDVKVASLPIKPVIRGGDASIACPVPVGCIPVRRTFGGEAAVEVGTSSLRSCLE